MKKRAYVTLRIDYDDESEVHPGNWGWASLLDLPDANNIAVVADNEDYALATPVRQP